MPEDGDQAARHARGAGPRRCRGLLSRGREPAVPVAYPVAGPVLLPSLACDGKEARGAVRADGTSLFLLSAATGGIVLAEREIPAKTNEIPEVGPMLLDLNERFPLAGWVMTADALHTQRGFATLACEDLLARYVLTVKGNQAGLYAALQQPTWAGARRHVTSDKGHGRRETRRHLVMDAPAEIRALFPHAAQVARVIRTRTVTRWKHNGKKRTRVTETHTETVYLITSLTAREAAPEHIAAYTRGHWGIENEVHLVRDVTLREDSSKVRADYRPRALATLRNVVMGLIRQDGHTASPPPSATPNTTSTCSSPCSASHQPCEQQEQLCPQPCQLAARNGWIKLARQQREYDQGWSHLGCHIDFAAIVRSKDRAASGARYTTATRPKGANGASSRHWGVRNLYTTSARTPQRTLTNFSARGPQRPGLARTGASRRRACSVVRRQGLVQPRYLDYVPEDCLIAGNVDASGIPANWAKQCAMGQPRSDGI